MPEKMFKKLNTLILPQWKVCFFATLIVGLFAHLYKITNWLPNWDSLVFRYDSQNMIAMGRWFLPVACGFSSFYDLPFLNGIIAIGFHALSGVCICSILNIQKKTTACLIGAVVVSFPSVTSIMMYNYVADGYSIAFFMATLAAWFMTKEKPRYIVSAILIALSTGIYQAYISVTIMLILLKLIDEIIYKKITFRQIMKKIGFMLLSGMAGMILYTVVLSILLKIFSIELLDYQGANAVASLSAIDLRSSLYIIKETFIHTFFDVSNGVNVYIILNVLVFAVTIIGYFVYAIKNKVYKHPANFILLIILCVMLIIGANILALINASVDYHNLMRMGYVVFYLFFLLLYERGTDKKEVYTCVKCWTVLLIALLIVLNQVVISNVSYHKAQIAYEKSYGVLLRVADRIEQTPGTDFCEKILVIGALENSETYSVNLTPEITGVTDGYIIRFDDEVVGQSVLTSALTDYCEMDYQFVSGDEKQKLLQRDEVKAMKQWPAKECVTVVDKTVVVKLGTEGENK